MPSLLTYCRHIHKDAVSYTRSMQAVTCRPHSGSALACWQAVMHLSKCARRCCYTRVAVRHIYAGIGRAPTLGQVPGPTSGLSSPHFQTSGSCHLALGMSQGQHGPCVDPTAHTASHSTPAASHLLIWISIEEGSCQLVSGMSRLLMSLLNCSGVGCKGLKT